MVISPQALGKVEPWTNRSEMIVTDESGMTYPSQYETEVLLKDGSRVLLRPIKESDAEQWLNFVSRLSPKTRRLRFHYAPGEMELEDAIRFCTVDYVNAFAFVAEFLVDKHQDIVAIGHYYRLPGKSSAEVALVIEDAYQGKGIGTKLIEWLANVARDNGITAFEAEILAENTPMLALFKDYGFHVKSGLEAGVYHVTFPITRTRRVMRMEEKRERHATISSLLPIMNPRSVALVGASREEGTIGNIILQCMLQNGFFGTVYPVNPNSKSVMSIKTYCSVLDISDEIDLAVIAVPAPLVSRVADECGQKGVRGIIVISDGFREIGDEGAAREKELRDMVLGHGMRLVGPNCMGIINTDPDIKLNASFSRTFPPHGNVAFLSQSGALGLAVLDYANDLKVGISSFLSVGNRADISANDLLQYWERDPSTKVILLYLESFGNPRKFSRIARRVSARKPIVAVKGGSTLVGSRAAASHTGALMTSEVASDALFHQTGIIRAATLGELFDVAMLFSSQPVPKGKRVAIITNGGGPGILASDACELHGLEVPQFSEETTKALRNALTRHVRINNPLDTTAGVAAGEFESALRILGEDTDNDAVIAIMIPPIVMETHDMENAVNRVAPLFQRRKKTLLTCFMGERGFKGVLSSRNGSIPCYPFPEDAVVALAKAAVHGQWLKRPQGRIPKIRGIRRSQATNIVESSAAKSTERPIWLSAEQTAELLRCYGIRVAETVIAHTATEAASLASGMGFPVAVKLASSTIVHKTDVGGIVLDLGTAEQVKQAFDDIETTLNWIGRREEMEGVLVQPMIKNGLEVIVGVTQDSSFGPLIMFGLGGIYTELFGDVVFRLHPLTDVDVQEMLGSTKMSGLLGGVRGMPPSDAASLKELLFRLSAMVEDLPQIAELDFNPVKVMPQGEGYWVIDSRIMLH